MPDLRWAPGKAEWRCDPVEFQHGPEVAPLLAVAAQGGAVGLGGPERRHLQTACALCLGTVPGASRVLDEAQPLLALREASPGLWAAGYSHLTCWEGSVSQCHKMRRSQRLFLLPLRP